MAFNSLVIQDLTYTQIGYTPLPVKVTYINGSALSVDSYTPSTGILQLTIVSGTSTATAIAAAVNASLVCNQYISCAVTGTGGTAQVSAVSASLAGALAASVKSSLAVGPITLTADTAGTAGNSIRFRFTTGAVAGSEVVTVASSDISVQISEGVSTYAQVKTAIEASGPAAALVDIASNGRALTAVARLSHAAAYTNLSGGLAAAPAVLVIQGVTITSNANTEALNSATFTMTTGATAGAEVVTMSGNNISIQISNGISTVTQIRTALQAAGAFTAIYTATGTASTTPLTVNQLSLAGATPVVRGVYKDGTTMALTSSYVAVPLGSVSQVDLINDETSGVKGINYSFDGTNQAGSLLFGQSMRLTGSFNSPVPSVIYVKFISSAPAYRLSATPR
jgi:hypothetical protein